MKRVFIHIGVHRTGSTALQRSLTESRSDLAAHEICYPGPKTNHTKMAWDLMKGQPEGWKMLDDYVFQSEAETIILSAEDFSLHTDLSWVEKVRAVSDVYVFVYLRRQDDWLMSWYNQHIKWPFSPSKSRMSPESFLERLQDFYWIDYQTMLERWALAVGKEKLRVRVVQPGDVTDVVEDFSRVLASIAPAIGTLLLTRRRTINDSLPVASLELARTLNLIDLAPSERQLVNEALRASFKDYRHYRTLFSPSTRRDILRRFAKQNKFVAEKYFGRQTLFDENISEEGYLSPEDRKQFAPEKTIHRLLSNLIEISKADAARQDRRSGNP